MPPHPTPLCLHLHFQFAIPRSCPAGVFDLWLLRHAQAVKPGSTIDLSVLPFETHLQGGCLHATSRPPGLGPVDQKHQSVDRAPVPGHPADLVAAYRHLTSSPTISADQPLLTYIHQGHCTTVPVPMLSKALSALLHAIGLDSGLYSLHSFMQGESHGCLQTGPGPD